MNGNIQIRLVPVEFLRPGPPHNQLLSPLTQYLAVCGDAGAGVVTVPYEHAAFERRLKELRYETGDASDRLAMLHDIGVEMGQILGAVPGLSGALSVGGGEGATLIHLRLTLSASELAFLPLELAKVPVGPRQTAESWLALQTRPPVCVTRSIRTVSSEGMVWPHRPRILFISGDPSYVPFEQHRAELIKAIQDFRYPGPDAPNQPAADGKREEFGDLLTILVNPTLADVLSEMGKGRYTHVHILTHGDAYGSSPGAYGLVLHEEVVSGEQFAGALTFVGSDQVHRPTVVTIASCDSGNVGTVAIPGASFAHALHQSGIPLVIASQFPLSKEGSVPIAGMLYGGLLWGEHPLILLQRLRAELHARYNSTWHDWASLVVYEALPRELEGQLDTLRYHQARGAINAALEGIDRAIQNKTEQPTAESLAQLDQAVERAIDRLPLNGTYAVECIGLRASARKRLSQAAFSLANDWRRAVTNWKDPYDLLEQAWVDYNQAVHGMLVNDRPVAQRVATLHWVLVQALSLSAVLGKEHDEGQWATATLSAKLYLDHALLEERAWAHCSLAELWLLKLACEGLPKAECDEAAAKACYHAKELLRLEPSRLAFTVKSTRRQFRRYVDWWSDPNFIQGLEKGGAKRIVSWQDSGLTETAKTIVKLLERREPPPEVQNAPPGGAAIGGDAPSPAPVSPASAPGAKPPPEKSKILARSHPQGRNSAATAAAAQRAKPCFEITMVPAGHGDALWIEYGGPERTNRCLIDCGTQATAKELLQRVKALPRQEQFFELLVLSHIDSDHIGGALPFFRAVQQGLRFGDIWFNGWRHVSGQLGARQGEMFSSAIQDLELPWNEWREGNAIVLPDDDLPTHTLPGGMTLTLLSPTREQLQRLAPDWARELKRYGLEPGGHVDYSHFLRGTPSSSTDVDELADSPFTGDAGKPNGTSIALLAEFGGAAILLAADAHAPVLEASIHRLLKKRGLERLKLAAFKVAHHGSQNNLSRDLLKLLECKHYLLSTNGDHFCHPDRQAVGRILKYGGKQPVLHFNYKSQYNEVWARPDLREKYAYSALYPSAEQPDAKLALLPAGS